MKPEVFGFEANLPESTRLTAFESSGNVSIITNPKGELFVKEQKLPLGRKKKIGR